MGRLCEKRESEEEFGVSEVRNRGLFDNDVTWVMI